jgi:hypothetical protein
MASPDWYAVLGVGRTASHAQIARAFRRLAFRWHPDRNLTQPELAHRQFLLVHQAYEVLTDPLRRRAFDATHGPPLRRGAAPAAGPPADARQKRAAPAPRPAAPRAAEPPAPLPHRVVSQAAWLLLGFAIKIVGFVTLLLVGSVAEKLAREDLQRKAPALTDFVFPIGRTLLVGGIVLLVVARFWLPFVSPRFAIVLIVVGVVTFAIERLALATVWAFGRGRRPKT